LPQQSVIEDLENGSLTYVIVEKFLSNLKEKFNGENSKTIKVVELEKIEQERKTMEEFVQKFRKTIRRSGHE